MARKARNAFKFCRVLFVPESSTTLLDRFRRHRSAEIDLTLRAPYRALLEKLGNPQTKLPPVIHVAGTNGKGSTCAFLRAMVEAAEYKAHVFTSPHLVTFHERIRLAGELIGEDELVQRLKLCEELSQPGDITYFEAATAVAFAAFADHAADVTILEVGLGGRLDSTNVVPRPAATVITRLSLDHREYLGDTLTHIAQEKAGIMRPHVPCFAAPQPAPEALAALRQEAAKLEAPLHVGGEDWRIEPTSDGFRYTDATRTLDLPPPALVGQHQFWNAGLAVATLAALPLTIPDDAVCRAMQNVTWPARLQRLTSGKLVDLLPPDWELWLDGGHNDSAGEVLATHIASWKNQDDRPLHIILGMLTTKTPQEFLNPFAPAIAQLRTLHIDNEPLSRTAQDLALSTGLEKAAPVANLIEALQSFPPAPRARVLICGSLYLAGQVLRQN